MPRRTGRLAAASIALGALWTGGVPWPGAPAPSTARAAEAAAQVVDLTYDVYVGGMHIFSFDIDMTLHPDRYRVDAAGVTRGMVGFLYGWDVKLAAEGSAREGRLAAGRYTSDSAWKGQRRTVALAFGEDGAYELHRAPPPEPDPDIEGGLPATVPDGTTDPLSVAVFASRAMERSGRCDQTVPVFDGQRRYDLTLTQIDATNLPANAYSIYQGPAVRCSVSVKRISGFRKSWRSKSQMEAGATSLPSLWIAAVSADLPPLPVRYEGAIALGNMVIHLTSAQVRTQRAEGED